MGKSILKFPNFDINMTKFGCSLRLIPHIYTVPFYLHCLLAFVHDLLTCRLSIRAKSHSGHNAYTVQAQAASYCVAYSPPPPYRVMYCNEREKKVMK